MAGTTNLLLKHLLPGKAVELGRLVLSPEYPEQDYFQPTEPSVGPQDILTQSLDHFEQTLGQANESGLKAYISKLLSGGHKAQSKSKMHIVSATCTTRQLQNSGLYLDQLCASRPGQFWLERAIRRDQDVFLVTGIKTVLDASIQDETCGGSDLDAKVRAPISDAATAGGVPIPIDGMLDVGVEAEWATTQASNTSFTAPGEQIFAVQYRKLRFARFSSCKVEDARLEKGDAWRMYLGGRGEEEDAEQVVSVAADDGVERSDVGACYESDEVAGESFMYPTK